MPPRDDCVAATLLVSSLAVREAVRGRAVAGILLASAGLIAVFAVACAEAMPVARDALGTATEDAVAATLLGTAAFTAFLLGSTVAVFLTHSTVRGDIERGLLQPLAVRPVPRAALVLGRVLAGAGLAAAYAILLWAAAVVAMRTAGDFTPAASVSPAVLLAGAVTLVAVTGVAASTVLGATGAGVGVLALVAAGFTVGLLAQLGTAIGTTVLGDIADVVSVLLPFEALYRDVLFRLGGEDAAEALGLGVGLGPFGGAREASTALLGWSAAWGAMMLALAVRRMHRIDM